MGAIKFKGRTALPSLKVESMKLLHACMHASSGSPKHWERLGERTHLSARICEEPWYNFPLLTSCGFALCAGCMGWGGYVPEARPLLADQQSRRFGAECASSSNQISPRLLGVHRRFGCRSSSVCEGFLSLTAGYLHFVPASYRTLYSLWNTFLCFASLPSSPSFAGPKPPAIYSTQDLRLVPRRLPRKSGLRLVNPNRQLPLPSSPLSAHCLLADASFNPTYFSPVIPKTNCCYQPSRLEIPNYYPALGHRRPVLTFQDARFRRFFLVAGLCRR